MNQIRSEDEMQKTDNFLVLFTHSWDEKEKEKEAEH